MDREVKGGVLLEVRAVEKWERGFWGEIWGFGLVLSHGFFSQSLKRLPSSRAEKVGKFLSFKYPRHYKKFEFFGVIQVCYNRVTGNEPNQTERNEPQKINDFSVFRNRDIMRVSRGLDKLKHNKIG